MKREKELVCIHYLHCLIRLDYDSENSITHEIESE